MFDAILDSPNTLPALLSIIIVLCAVGAWSLLGNYHD